MPKISKWISNISNITFICISVVIATVVTSTNAHANATSFSKADIALLGSLQPSLHNHVVVKPSSKGVVVQTVDLGNSSKIARALQEKDLSPQMHEAITHLTTKITVTTKTTVTSTKAVTNLLHPHDVSTCTTASGQMTGSDFLGISLWTYSVSQGFCSNGTYITSLGGRVPHGAGLTLGWSYSGDSSSLTQPSYGDPLIGGTTEYNVGIFNNSPINITNIETVNVHITLYMFGGGYWDVGVFTS